MKLNMHPHAMLIRPSKSVLLWLAIHAFVVAPVQAELISVSASGTISKNSSADTTIPVGTPWTFEIIYDTAAPDLDFELTGAPIATFGRFTNTGATPAVTFLHYHAANYEVTIDDPKDFGAFSEIHITLGRVNVMEINLNAPGLFPPLAGGPVSFQAEFNDGLQSDFGDIPPSIIMSDALLTDTSIGLQSFQSAAVVLLPSSGGVVLGGLSDMSSLTFSVVPEPSSLVAAIIGGLGMLLLRRSRQNDSAAGNKQKLRSSNQR
jgi:hypothetical protein